MTLPDNYGIATFKFEITASGSQSVVTMGFHNTPLDDASTIADTLGAVWDAEMTGSLLCNTYTFVSCYVLLSIGGVEQSGESPVGTVGSNTSDPSTPATAVGVKKVTSYAGKKYRGRMYLPAGYVSENHVGADGNIGSTEVSALQGAMDNVLAGFSANSYPAYLLHTDATAPTPISSLIVRNHVRTQRRRQKLL